MKKARQLAAIVLASFMAVQTPYVVYGADAVKETVKVSNQITAKVKEVQKYGNLTMEIKPKALYDAGFELGDIITVTVGQQKLEMPFCTSYSDVDTGSLVLRDDQKEDLLVVAINMGNFAKTYQVVAGDQVGFEIKEKAGYLNEYNLRQLKRSNNRQDYKTDSVFTNFRGITTKGIKPGVLYRSSSPINNEIKRAAYADQLSQAVGVQTVLNLADTASNISDYTGAKDFNSPYYKSLYDKGEVTTLNMDVDLGSEAFGKKLAEGLRFLSKNKAPYLIHCNEGKDRAGFVSATLEALMGASLDEIVADYMTTYENYYGVARGSKQYEEIAKSNIIASVTTILCGQKKGSDISKTDLSKAAQDYLIRMGMTAEEVQNVKKALSAEPVFQTKAITGTVKEIEKYGHASTDITIEAFNQLGYQFGDMVTVVFDNGFVLEAPYLDGYFVNNGMPLVRAYPGHQTIGICINYDKLSEIGKIAAGQKVTLMLAKEKGYLDQYEVRKLTRSNARKDYASDEIFANFRNVTTGKLGKNILYRSASPVNNEIGRAACADTLCQQAKINTVINLADSKENLTTYMSQADYQSPYYQALNAKGNVLALNMSLAYQSDDFKKNVIKAVRYMAQKEGPYLVHCTEGKDRTGFVVALLEAYMGAGKDEIIADYAQSYINFYGIQKDSKQYEVVSQDVITMLKYIVQSDELTSENLQKGAKDYLISGGMSEEELKTLTEHLSKLK